MAYVNNPDLYKAGIAVLAGPDASSAVESGRGSLVKLQQMQHFTTVSCFPCCQVLYVAVLVHPDGAKALFMSRDVRDLQWGLPQPSYTACCP